MTLNRRVFAATGVSADLDHDVAGVWDYHRPFRFLEADPVGGNRWVSLRWGNRCRGSKTPGSCAAAAVILTTWCCRGWCSVMCCARRMRTTITQSIRRCSVPHAYRSELARQILKVPESRVSVVAGDIGGSFGMKSAIYNEVALVLLASKLLGRPAFSIRRSSRT